MYDYLKVYNTIQEKVDNGELSINIAEKANDIAYEKYLEEYEYLYGEGVKDTIKDGKEKLGGVVNKVTDSYNKSVNNRSEKVAKAIIKKPSENANEVSIKRYQEKINKVKCAYKVGEILAVNLALLVIPGPANLTFNAGVTASLAKSNDPSDAKLKAIITKVKSFNNKITSMASKLKGKVISAKEDLEIKKASAEGLNLTKELNRVNSKPVVVKESSRNVDFDIALFDDTSKDTIFISLEKYIVETEYNDDTYQKISNFIESL